MAREGHGHRHHHHERSRDHEWKEEDADHFLEQARYDADKRYPPIAVRVAEHAPRHREGPVVLDLGCGPALLLPELAKVLPRARLIGMDPSKPMLSLARRVLEDAPPGTYQLMEGTAEDIPLEDGSVDAVVALKNLHEWEDANKGMSEVARVLGPGGVLVLRDANKGYPYWKLRLWVTWLRMTRGRIATHGILGPYPDAYTPEQAEALLAEAGLQVLEQDAGSVEFLYVARRP